MGKNRKDGGQLLRHAREAAVRHGGDYVRSLPVLLKWLLIAGLVGVIVGAAASGFAHVLIYVNQLRAAWPMLVLGLPLGGLLIVFLYRVTKNHDDRGTNTVLASIQSSSEISFKMAPLIFLSTVITQLFGGSAGREGAALQLGGSIAKKLGSLLRLKPFDRRIIVMCGMSAGFSAMFGTPLAAAVFSLEVVAVGAMHYAALVPCVTASLTAHMMAGLLKVPPEIFPVADLGSLSPLSFLQVVGLSAAVAAAGILFCLILHKAEHLYEKHLRNPYLRIAVGGLLVMGLSFLPGMKPYLGSGMGIIEHIFPGGEADSLSFLLKMLFTALTLGAGFKGGEIVPSFTIGAALGCVLAPVLGLPVPLAAACGMTGLFCSVTNCPITALLIAFELFGFAGMPYYLTAAAVSYLLSGYHSLYHKQKILYSKTGWSRRDQEADDLERNGEPE